MRIETSTNDLFYVIGSDLRLFKLEKDQIQCKLISTEFQSIRALAWNPTILNMSAIASQGKITIANITESDSQYQINIQSDVKKNRNCNVVAWNPQVPMQLLAGYERHRGDSGLFFYNTEHGFQELQQYAPSLAITSACWLNSNAIAGVGFRWIRSFDPRTPNSSVLNIVTKAVYGLTKDPYHEHRFASYTDDGVICLWDIRYTKSVLSLQSEFKTGISDISFGDCNVLSALGRDSSTVRLWHLLDQPEHKPMFQIESDAADQNDQVQIMTSRQCKPSQAMIHHYKWIQRDQPTMLVCAGRESKPFLYSLPSVKKLSWSKGLAIATEKQIQSCSLVKKDDISEIMYKYAVQGYATNVEKNIEIVKENEYLQSTWKFIDALQSAPFGAFELDGNSVVSLGLQQIIQTMPQSHSNYF
jgi:WD40 repeat protein